MQLARLFKDFSLYSIEPVAFKIVSFLLLPLYTAYLLPAEFGELQFIISLGTFLRSVSQFGLNTAFWKFKNDFPSEKLPDLSFNVMATQFYIGSIVVALSSIVVFATEESTWKWLFIFYLLALLVKLISENYLMVSRASQQPKLYLRITLTQLVVFVTCNILFITTLGWGIFGIVSAYMVAFMLTSMVYYRRMKSLVVGSLSKDLQKKLVAFGGPLLLGNLSILILSISDRWFLMTFSTETELGLYSYGYKFADLLGTFMTYAFQLAWAPLAWKAITNDAGRKLYFQVEKLIMIGFPVFVLLSLPVLFFVARFITVNPEFIAGLNITYIIAFSHIFYAYYSFNSVKNLHFNKRNNIVSGNIVAAVLNTALNIALITTYGMLGAALATIISYIVMYAWIEFVRIPELDSYKNHRWKLLVINVIALAACTGITVMQFGNASDWTIALSSFAAALVLVGLSFLLGIISRSSMVKLKDEFISLRKKPTPH